MSNYWLEGTATTPDRQQPCAHCRSLPVNCPTLTRLQLLGCKQACQVHASVCDCDTVHVHA
jgi:hypothetical protein